MFLPSLALAANVAFVVASPPALDSLNLQRRATSPYTPQTVACPSSPLIRVGHGISTDESDYLAKRSPKAAAALAAWLKTTGASFPKPKTYPTLGLTTSGGGLRSLLTGAGVHKALDGQDSQVSTSGLYQALTYEAGLSGGGWMLSSFAGNNWPTVSSLQESLWDQAFIDGLSNPPNFGTVEIALGEALLGKKGAGFQIGLTDIYGRLLGYQLLSGKDGGVGSTMSGIASLGNFTSHAVPYPILTSLGTPNGALLPAFNATQYELHPFEFGSWDTGVEAFTPMKYLGSDLANGKPTNPKSCITGFDNLGFTLGTTSSIFSALKAAGLANTPDVTKIEAALKLLNLPITPEIFFANYPNPFFKSSKSPIVASAPSLNLIDGGDDKPDQGDPIWPMIHRNLDVLIVSANSADTTKNFPSGQEIHNTYLRAKTVGLTRMPVIPPASVFAKEGLSNRSVFFGCSETNAMTIVYLPNRDITFDSGTSTFELNYSKTKTADMIANGMQIATQAGSKDWGVCLGCAIMAKSQTTLPSACDACFKKYCFGAPPSKSSSSKPSSSTNPSTGAGSSLSASATKGLIGLSLLGAFLL